MIAAITSDQASTGLSQECNLFLCSGNLCRQSPHWPSLSQFLMTGQQLHCLQDGTTLPRASFAAIARGLAKPASYYRSTGGVCQHTCGLNRLLLCKIGIQLAWISTRHQASMNDCMLYYLSIALLLKTSLGATMHAALFATL